MIPKKILVLLLLILSGIFAIAQPPSNQIFSEISKISGEFGGSLTTNESVVSSDKFIDASVIANYSSSITSDQICLSLGRYEVEQGWSLGGNGKEIFYSGPESKSVKFFVLCDKGNKIKETIPLFPADKINLDYVRHCEQFNPENDKSVCAVVLSEARTIPKPELQQGFIVLFLMLVITLVPLILVLRSDKFELKAIYALKLFLIIAAIISVFFFAGLSTILLAILMLSVTFAQSIFSLSSMILGFTQNESKNIKRAVFAVLVFELIALLLILIIISPFV
jgi:hypothetical protein